MSTKIYTAWKMPVEVFETTFIESYREHVFKKIEERIKLMMTHFNIDEYQEKKYNQYPVDIDLEEYKQKYHSVHLLEAVLLSCLKASKNHRKVAFFDIDSSLSVWIYQGFVYCIPFGDASFYEGYKHEQVKDFSYWNNTDQPDNVDDAEWDNRSKVWDEICLKDNWENSRLIHIILSAKDDIGMLEICKRILKDDRAYTVFPFEESKVFLATKADGASKGVFRTLHDAAKAIAENVKFEIVGTEIVNTETKEVLGNVVSYAIQGVL